MVNTFPFTVDGRCTRSNLFSPKWRWEMWIYILDPKSPWMKQSEILPMEANGRGITMKGRDSFPTVRAVAGETKAYVCMPGDKISSLHFTAVCQRPGGMWAAEGRKYLRLCLQETASGREELPEVPTEAASAAPEWSSTVRDHSPDASHRGRGRCHWEPPLLSLRLRMAPLWSLIHTSPSSPCALYVTTHLSLPTTHISSSRDVRWYVKWTLRSTAEKWMRQHPPQS